MGPAKNSKCTSNELFPKTVCVILIHKMPLLLGIVAQLPCIVSSQILASWMNQHKLRNPSVLLNELVCCHCYSLLLGCLKFSHLACRNVFHMAWEISQSFPHWLLDNSSLYTVPFCFMNHRASLETKARKECIMSRSESQMMWVINTTWHRITVSMLSLEWL